MYIKKSLLVMFIASFLQCELQIRPKHSKIKKVTFSDFYCLINAKFWNTNKKNIYKKVTFSDIYCFIFTIVNYK